MRTAAREGVQPLYKFLPYPVDGDSPDHNRELRRRVDALITGGELYFPTAIQLNDPFEARPRFVPISRDPSEMCAAMQKMLDDKGHEELGLTAEQAEFFRQQTRVDPQRIVDQLTGKWVSRFRAEFPMCCFSARQDFIPMWSYYACGHSGVAVHFDATLVPFGTSVAVEYSAAYPEITFPGPQDPDRLMQLSLLWKSEEWRAEHEYRFVNYPKDADNPAAGRVLTGIFGWRNDQLAVMPPQIISGVTLGASLLADHRAHLQRLCAVRTPPLTVFLATLDEGRYKLNFRPA